MPVGYFHVVFSVPAELADIALQNKSQIYNLRSARRRRPCSPSPPTGAISARIGITAVLHTWGSALTHHQHIHIIVPGGGISLDGTRWVSSRSSFLLPVRVLSKLFRRLFLTRLLELYAAGELAFFGGQAGLRDRRAFLRLIAKMRQKNWVVYAKPPFAGPLALHAPLCHLKPPADLARRQWRHLPHQGLSARWGSALWSDDARHR